MSATLALHLPQGWQQTNVVRHIDAPFSDEALAEPVQQWIDLGPANTEGLPVPTHDDTSWVVKRAGQELDLSAQQGPYAPLHARFFSAARAILGHERYMSSSVRARHASAALEPGQTHTYPTPHRDAWEAPATPGGLPVMRLIGVVCGEVGLRVVQGGYDRQDFRGRNYLPADRTAIQEAVEVPPNRLLILSAAAVHFAQPAPQPIGRRHFLHWPLYF